MPEGRLRPCGETVRFLAALIAAVVFVCGASSCMKTTSSRALETAFPSLLVCNSWQDLNQDGMAGNDEWVGRKGRFQKDEAIIIAGWSALRAARMRLVIRRNETELVEDLTYAQPGHETLSWLVYNGAGLYEKAGDGRYTVTFYVNDAPVDTIQFTILP